MTPAPRLRALAVVILAVACGGTTSSEGESSAASSSSSTSAAASDTTTAADATTMTAADTTTTASTTTTSETTTSETTTEGAPTCATATFPAWLADQPVDVFFEIPDTAGAGGAAITAYSGFALRDSTSEIVIAAAGGHSDSADNRVVSLDLTADNPTWTLRHASSVDTPIDVAYYPDGLPSARHVYQSAHVVEALDRVFLVGARFVYGSAVTFPTVDGFDLTANTWDPEGTWASVPDGASFGALRLRPGEDIITSSLWAWNAVDAAWSQPVTSPVDTPVRWPIAHDAARDRLLALQWGDGQGYDGPTIHASQVDLATGVQTLVTLADGDALTMFAAEAPTYAAMDYDPENDRFLFYSGQGAAAGRIYVVEAAATDARTIALFEPGPGSIAPPASPDSGIHNRFRYVPELCGFVLVVDQNTNAFFLRTAGG